MENDTGVKKITIDLKVLGMSLLLISVALGALVLRFNTFYLSHWRGDQSHFLTLAMKLDHQGLAGYNLRETRVFFWKVSENPEVRLAIVDDKKKGEIGDLLTVLKNIKQGYYDQPLHMRAPMFPFMLMMSHRLFAQTKQPYTICSTNLGEKVKELSPNVVLEAQYWAVIVPLFFNVAVILLTALLAWRIFGRFRTGFYASVLMCVNPLSIWLAHKLLSEDVAAFFVLCSFHLFLLFYPKQNKGGIFLAGLMGGLAVLTNQRLGLILVVIGLYTFWTAMEQAPKTERFLKRVLKAITNRPLWIYTAALFTVSGFWFARVWATYGHPLHVPFTGSFKSNAEDVSGWFVAVADRPHTLILFSIGVIVLSPLFGLALLTLRRSYGRLKGRLTDPQLTGMVFCWMWILVFFLYLSEPWNLFSVGNKEHRYFYAVYPAIACLAAFVLDRLRARLNKLTHNPILGEIAVLLLLAANALYTIPKAAPYIFSDSLLF